MEPPFRGSRPDTVWLAALRSPSAERSFAAPREGWYTPCLLQDSPPPVFAPFALARLRTLALCAAASLCLLVCVRVHAGVLARRAAARAPVLRAMARVVGSELALDADARWIRHPTRSEPWAYGHDGPGLPDGDPAGALIGPPRSLSAGPFVTPARLRRAQGVLR